MRDAKEYILAAFSRAFAKVAKESFTVSPTPSRFTR